MYIKDYCIKDYCSGMEIKLTAWKVKLFDAICKTERMGSKDKEKAMASINDIKIIIMDMEAKIDQLKTEYSTEYSPQKKKIDEGAMGINRDAVRFLGLQQMEILLLCNPLTSGNGFTDRWNRYTKFSR